MKKRSIKDLLPNPNKRYKQGFYDTYNPKKYFGKRPIIYRSSLELKFMTWCENSSLISSWSSEPEPGIPYFDIKGGYHNYFPDFLVQTISGQKWLIEVKPKKDIPRDSISIRTNQVHAQNALKWKAAVEYCKNRGMEFKIVTEDFFGNSVGKMINR